MNTELMKEIVYSWLSEGRMFTAFEVSLELKSKGEKLRHRQMKETIHEVIFDIAPHFDYTRILMDVGAPHPAWVYYPEGQNPYSYLPLERRDHLPVPDIKVTGTPITKGSDVPQDAYGTDGRGRLCIPVGLLSKIGAKPGDTVSVEAGEEFVKIYKGVFSDTLYTVEPDGNVRLCQSTLSKGKLGGLQCYRISGSDGAISITNYNKV